jgi:hypothetical protein
MRMLKLPTIGTMRSFVESADVVFVRPTYTLQRENWKVFILRTYPLSWGMSGTERWLPWGVRWKDFQWGKGLSVNPKRDAVCVLDAWRVDTIYARVPPVRIRDTSSMGTM